MLLIFHTNKCFWIVTATTLLLYKKNYKINKRWNEWCGKAIDSNRKFSANLLTRKKYCFKLSLNKKHSWNCQFLQESFSKMFLRFTLINVFQTINLIAVIFTYMIYMYKSRWDTNTRSENIKLCNWNNGFLFKWYVYGGYFNRMEEERGIVKLLLF